MSSVAREASAWGLGNQNFQLGLAKAEGRNRTYELIGRALYWVFLPFVVLGAVLLAGRSRQRFVVVMAPVVVAVVTVALTYGSTRLRVVAEPSLAIMAAIGVVSAGQWLCFHAWAAERRSSPELGPRSPDRSALTSALWSRFCGVVSRLFTRL